WFYDLETNERKQVTYFRDYDVKWPSNGPGPDGKGEIVFEYNARLYLLDLESEQSSPVNISVPGARPKLRPIRKDVSGRLSNWYVSPNAKRVLVDTRGDVWSLPAKNGTPRNLTRTSGVAEREPSWSPDGKWITYISDESDENELVMRSADRRGEPETVTSMGPGYRYQPVWSPDSKWMVLVDHESKFYLFDVEEREVRYFDRVNISGWRWGVPMKFRWSPDSQWLTYSKPNQDNMNVIILYNVQKDELHEVTEGMFVDFLPTFDRKGDFLYFFSEREISQPKYADGGLTFIYDNTAILHAIPLRSDVTNPFKAKSDEEEVEKRAEDEEAEKEDKDNESECEDPNDSDCKDSSECSGKDEEKPEPKKDKDKKKPEPVEIDLEDLEARAFRLPI
ncbi:MAG: PD40 domain-containing protein, partial [Phycisphaerales bacterium]